MTKESLPMNDQAELVRVVVLACSEAWAAARGKDDRRARSSALKVFFESPADFGDQIRAEADFIEHVHNRYDADVHVLVSNAPAGAGRREYTVALTGFGRFANLQIVAHVGVSRRRMPKTAAASVDHRTPDTAAPVRRHAVRAPGANINSHY
jgi:hypothetical protein